MICGEGRGAAALAGPLSGGGAADGAGGSIAPDGRQCPEIGEQFLGVGESLFVGRFEPAEFPEIGHARGFQREHHFGEVQPPHLGQFLRRPVRVFLA